MNLTEIIRREYGTVEENIHNVAKIDGKLFEQFFQIYSSVQNTEGIVNHSYYDSLYETIWEKIMTEHFSYTPEDICSISILGTTFSDQENIGFFLSCLINIHYENTKYSGIYHLRTKEYSCPIRALGIHTDGARIVIEGDVGNECGKLMQAGSLFVEGNSIDEMCGTKIFSHIGSEMQGGLLKISGNADIVGYGMKGGLLYIGGNAKSQVGGRMQDGYIFVQKNVFGSVGFGMEGGTITVKGDVLEPVGQEMINGEIHINGSLPERERMNGIHVFIGPNARVYQNEVLIYGTQKNEQGKTIYGEPDEA